MDEKIFQLNLVAPDKVVFKGNVNSFSAPGEVGSFQVLYNHAHLLSSLTVGEIKYTDPDGTTVYYATSGGFVEVRENRVLALLETAERAEEIDVERAEDAKQRAEKRLKERNPETDIDRAVRARERALNRIRIANRVAHAMA